MWQALVGETDSRFMPLWIVASNGFEEVMDFLTSVGTNVNVSARDVDRMKIAVGVSRLKDDLRVLEVSAESGAEMRG